jgi:hypothetical protein
MYFGWSILPPKYPCLESRALLRDANLFATMGIRNARLERNGDGTSTVNRSTWFATDLIWSPMKYSAWGATHSTFPRQFAGACGSSELKTNPDALLSEEPYSILQGAHPHRQAELVFQPLKGRMKGRPKVAGLVH